MNKEELIEWLNNQPNDIQIFMAKKIEYDCMDIKIFLKLKEKEFIEWYFGM